MPYIVDHYQITHENKYIGNYYVFSDHSYEYIVTSWEQDLVNVKDRLKELGLLKNIEQKKPIAAIENLMTEANRVKGLKRPIFDDGYFRITRIPNETDERFVVYRRNANKNEQGYSEEDHSTPHYEGPHTPEGMREWTNWYAFTKMDDGTYEAALDEAWWWGGGHNDGGTIHSEIPEEWFELPYDEFLDRVVTLSAASHYKFTAEHLKGMKGLKEFFGY